MLGRLKWLVGFGAGYVLGARAGRERYDQIAGRAQELWSDPRVQEKAGQAQQMVKEKADQAQQLVKREGGGKTNGNGAGSDSRRASGAGIESGTTASQRRVRLADRSGTGSGVVVSHTADPQRDPRRRRPGVPAIEALDR